MRLVDYLDKGASIDPAAPCLTTDGSTLTYAEVQSLAQRIANALAARGIRPGDKVGFPILTHGGQIVIMRSADVGQFLGLIERHHVTHTFLPPTVIYMVLAHEALTTTDLSSLQCFWYGAAPMSVSKLTDAIHRIGPVMAQLFGQTEAPMMISTMAPADHCNPDGSIATARLAPAGRPWPLTTVAIMAPGGFNVYSVEVEQAALSHPDIQDCAVIGVPDEKWGERVVAVAQARAGSDPDPNDVVAHIKSRVGSVKAPKEVLVWADLPRSKVGKVLRTEIKARLHNEG